MKIFIRGPLGLRNWFIVMFALIASTARAESTLASDGASIARRIGRADRAEILVRLDLKTGFREVVIVKDPVRIHAFAGHFTSGTRDRNMLGTVIGPPQIEFFVNGARSLSFHESGDNAWWVGDQSGIILTLPKADFAALKLMLSDAIPKS